MANSVSKTISGANEWTEWISPTYDNHSNRLDISVDCESAWSGTIKLQKKNKGAADSTAKTVETYTGDDEDYVEDTVRGVLYRIGCATGDHSAGTAAVELYKKKV